MSLKAHTALGRGIARQHALHAMAGSKSNVTVPIAHASEPHRFAGNRELDELESEVASRKQRVRYDAWADSGSGSLSARSTNWRVDEHVTASQKSTHWLDDYLSGSQEQSAAPRAKNAAELLDAERFALAKKLIGENKSAAAVVPPRCERPHSRTINPVPQPTDEPNNQSRYQTWQPFAFKFRGPCRQV